MPEENNLVAHFCTYKRWQLRDRDNLEALRKLVAEEIVPRYAILPGCQKLSLELIDESDAVLTIQVWEDRTTWETVLQSEAYARWFREYQPILELWDELASFVDEWTADAMEIDPPGQSD